VIISWRRPVWIRDFSTS